MIDVPSVDKLQKQYGINFRACFVPADLPEGDYTASTATRAIITLRQSENKMSSCGYRALRYIDGISKTFNDGKKRGR